MNYLLKFVGSAILLSVCNITSAQGISEAICRNHQNTMDVIFHWREIGIPIQNAKEGFDHEDNYELRWWLEGVVKDVYKDPAAGRKFIESGAFFNKCLEIHRGY